AGITSYIPKCLEPFRKDKMPMEEIFFHRYQMWIDGNATSYSKSGWRLYTGSTVFKEDSDYVQWYFQDLRPWVHYIPIDKGLNNLVERLIEVQENETLGQEVASNGRAFAISHISSSSIREYMMALIREYLCCPVTSFCEKCQR
ncbi:MAG: glycosyl transferase family 90, partial [Chlamydiales bacterium]